MLTPSLVRHTRVARLVIGGGLAGLLLTVAASPVQAGLRGRANWVSLVKDAEVIAVAHIVGTPVYVAHKPDQEWGKSWDFHARLRIDEVLKGQCTEHEIPVILQYGLSPSEYLKDGQTTHLWRMRQKSVLAIYDTYSDTFGLPPILADARQPAVWLLGHYPDQVGRGGAATQDLSVYRPEQLQPISMLPFFRAILKPAPLTQQLALLHDPNPHDRAEYLQYFLDHYEKGAFPAVAALLGDKDLTVDNLAVEACVKLGGQAAIPYLRPLLDSDDRDAAWLAARALARLHAAASPKP